jgi:hypothetical protein
MSRNFCNGNDRSAATAMDCIQQGNAELDWGFDNVIHVRDDGTSTTVPTAAA